MNALTHFTLSQAAKSAILSAESAKSEAAKSGVNAVIALSFDNASHSFRHGDAAKLADVLKANGFKSAVAKFYSEKTASVCAFVQRKALLSVAGMARGEEKTAAYNEAVAQSLRDLSLLKSVAAVMAAVKPPKADEKTDEKTSNLASVNLVCDSVAPFFTLLAMFAAGQHQAMVAQAMAAKVPAAKVPAAKKPTAKKEKIAA